MAPGIKVCQNLQTFSTHINNPNIRANTEALIIAAQKLVLNTRTIRHEI